MTHEPVLLAEVLEFLRTSLHGIAEPRIVDGTLGLGGYSESILEGLPGARVLGVDRDPMAIALSERRLERFASRFRAVHGGFGGIGALVREDAPFDALVFDLGVSNMQLSEAERGFSFQHDGPLDMRMDPHGDAPTAAEVLEEKSAEELARIFWEYGGERYSRRIASRIESERRRGRRLATTGDLVALIRGLLPAPVQRKMGIHPARRVFQALRIFVNDELAELESMLESLPGLAAEGCVVVIVSYHSLEDRIVKHRFRAWEKEEKRGKVLTRHPILPQEEETARNFKARSAKLRVFVFS
ncbi:16S rRNA (cytosine(1402)-N(4))-methyltransferase RsmH [Fretibacterium sp. OH1220_COT-178]|uniref:16S rRNA (cytosine(1402)-N(4))-methyltransferase RsmH n=1 Tax=Fretibacterium sp. OH1220_COT-178 TaxID=2491047 RepID=UPI001F427BCF|nr:16S rRNA (cytosine(1402)-N(4))-methyltransferase RsmH [Fretibacterium sp. OH1220_COT-178]